MTLTELIDESFNPNVYQIYSKLVVNTKERNMTDILSDIRAITGITIVHVQGANNNIHSVRHVTSISIKIDPAPFKPFNREVFKNILLQIKKVPAVLSAHFTSTPIAI